MNLHANAVLNQHVFSPERINLKHNLLETNALTVSDLICIEMFFLALPGLFYTLDSRILFPKPHHFCGQTFARSARSS